MRTAPRSPRASERGSILIWVALFILIMPYFPKIREKYFFALHTKTEHINVQPPHLIRVLFHFILR